jgi:Tfp pilus assembly protein FimT
MNQRTHPALTVVEILLIIGIIGSLAVMAIVSMNIHWELGNAQLVQPVATP